MVCEDVDNELPEHVIVEEGWRCSICIIVDQRRDINLLLSEQRAFVEDVCSDRDLVERRHDEVETR